MGVHSMIKVRRLLGAPLAVASLSLGVALAGTATRSPIWMTRSCS